MDGKNLRRSVWVALALIALGTADAHAQALKITFLGTGAPKPVMHRFGPSILVEAGEQKILFDAGRGALQRLTQAKVRWQEVDAVFLTHLHSDHVVGFPDLWLTGWLVSPGRDRAAPVWGPSGTKEMMSHLKQAYAFVRPLGKVQWLCGFVRLTDHGASLSLQTPAQLAWPRKFMAQAAGSRIWLPLLTPDRARRKRALRLDLS